MALNIKDPEADRLAGEIAAITGESKTRAVRVALAERKARLEGPTPGEKRRRLQEFMEHEIWPQLPPSERAAVLTKADREEILGFGPDGV